MPLKTFSEKPSSALTPKVVHHHHLFSIAFFELGEVLYDISLLTFSKSSDVFINSKVLGLGKVMICCNNLNKVGPV